MIVTIDLSDIVFVVVIALLSVVVLVGWILLIIKGG